MFEFWRRDCRLAMVLGKKVLVLHYVSIERLEASTPGASTPSHVVVDYRSLLYRSSMIA